MKEERLLMDAAAIRRTLTRLSHEIVEKNKGADNLCLVGIKRRGEIIARRICGLLESSYGVSPDTAGIDIGMYRDDLVSGFFVPDASVNDLGFSIDNKSVILCDDVLIRGAACARRSRRSLSWGGPRVSAFWCLPTAAGGKCPYARILSVKISPPRVRNFWTWRLRRSRAKTV